MKMYMAGLNTIQLYVCLIPLVSSAVSEIKHLKVVAL